MGRARIGAGDWAVAAGVAAVLLAVGVSGQRPAGLDLLGDALLVAGGLALAARRRAPVPVLAVTGLCVVGYRATGLDVPAVAYLFAVYAAVRAGHRVVTVAVSVAMLVALPLAVMASGLRPAGEAFAQARSVLEIAWLIAAGAAGEALRQAERRADEAERTREETARRRAGEERLHIARELHDSLTQQISVIKVQAEVAVHLARRRGEPVPDALLAIREAGREASRELRATLEALRDDGAGGHSAGGHSAGGHSAGGHGTDGHGAGDDGCDRTGGAADRRSPAQGLDQVPELVRRARTTGLDATLTIEGARDDVPATVDRTAYRIVQESLTNITRHAAAATASVRIGYRPGALTIQVDDDGTATPDTAPVPGVGLIGMRERVTALGGRLRAEPRRGGGFTVRAELPVDRTP